MRPGDTKTRIPVPRRKVMTPLATLLLGATTPRVVDPEDRVKQECDAR